MIWFHQWSKKDFICGFDHRPVWRRNLIVLLIPLNPISKVNILLFPFQHFFLKRSFSVRSHVQQIDADRITALNPRLSIDFFTKISTTKKRNICREIEPRDRRSWCVARHVIGDRDGILFESRGSLWMRSWCHGEIVQLLPIRDRCG